MRGDPESTEEENSGDGARAEALAARLKPLSSEATVLLGTRLLGIDEAAGTVRFAFVGRADFLNVLGTIQGGLAAAMLDEAAGLTARLLGPPGLQVPTLGFNVHFLKPVPAGEVQAVGRVLRAGGRVAFVEADLLDGEDELLARMSVTALIRTSQ